MWKSLLRAAATNHFTAYFNRGNVMFESWYQDHYHEMSDAGRWFGGVGLNLLPVETWEKRSYRVLITRLSTARDTADSFTHQLLYQIASEIPGIFPDIAYLPPKNAPECAILWGV